MEILDKRKRANGGIHLTYTALDGNNIVPAHRTGMEFKIIKSYCRMVGQQRQEKTHLLVHSYYYAGFHRCKIKNRSCPARAHATPVKV